MIVLYYFFPFRPEYFLGVLFLYSSKQYRDVLLLVLPGNNILYPFRKGSRKKVVSLPLDL